MADGRRQLRIFVGLTEVSGYYSRLHRGLLELGLEADFFSLQDHKFGYGAGGNAWPARLARRAVQSRVRNSGSTWVMRCFSLVAVAFTRLIFLGWALCRYDVFLMGGGSSFFQFRELALMRLLGRRVIYTFHGTDSRPAWMDGFCQGTSRLRADTTDGWRPSEDDIRTYKAVSIHI